MAHWQRIAQSADHEQCGREPADGGPLDAGRSTVALPADGLRLLYPDADADLVRPAQRHAEPAIVDAVVGPEGGWSEKELAQARGAGVQAVRFGPRVLRTETAGLALTAAGALLGW